MSQALTLPLLRGATTLEAALEEEDNMLLSLAYPEQRLDFFSWLVIHHKDIEDTVSHHLGLTRSEICRLGEVREWIHGSFNVCIPVYVDNWTKHPGRRVIIRFPLPYKIGESTCPGNTDEKLRCEAATFIWIREHCPHVPIPHLWGFGFVGGQSFTKPESVPLKTKLIWHLRRHISSLFGFTLPCRYICHSRQFLLEFGYLVMDYVEGTGINLLSETWEEFQHCEVRRANLLRDLSRIMLSLSQSPLPRIGSLTLDSNGIIQLTNRPLTLRLQQSENDQIPTNIERGLTYSATDGYYLDLLSCHDSRIRHQPNSLNDEDDGRAQMANLTIMRALLSHFTNREFRHGPFVFRLTDLHQSNIFVDNDWHIKCLIDLEWACSLPVETLRPPYWLTGCPADDLVGQRLDRFSKAHHEFMEIFEEEEKSFPPRNGVASYRTNIMKRGWKIGNFWYFQALDSPKGLYNIFRDHIQPLFAPSHNVDPDYPRIVSEYWAVDGKDVISAKLRDKEMYEKLLRQNFENASSNTSKHFFEQSFGIHRSIQL